MELSYSYSSGHCRWPYCTVGHLAQVAALYRWPYCTLGHTAQVAILQAGGVLQETRTVEAVATDLAKAILTAGTSSISSITYIVMAYIVMA